MSSIRNSLAIGALTRGADIVIAFVGSIIISRLLTPVEIGIYSVSVAFIAIVQMLRDFGVGQYLVQERELTPGRIRAAIFVITGTSWGLGALVFLARVPLAAFYDEAGVREVLLVVSATFILLPLSAPVISMLRRNLRFDQLAKIAVVEGTIRNGAAIGFAYHGFGYMSLAWGSLAASVTAAGLALYFRPAEMPMMPSFREVRRVVSFGALASAGNLSNMLARSAPDLILARTLGFSEVAIYNKGFALLSLCTTQLMAIPRGVMFPYFSRTQSREESRALYKTSVDNMSALVAPVLAFGAASAPDLVIALWGDQWHAAVPLGILFCLIGAATVPFLLAPVLLVSIGAVKTVLHAESVALVLTVLTLLASVWLPLTWVVGLGVLAKVAHSWIVQRELDRRLGLSIGEAFRTARFGYVTAVAVGVPVLLLQLAGHRLALNPYQSVAVQAATAGVLWLACTAWLSHPLWGEMKRLLARISGRRRE